MSPSSSSPGISFSDLRTGLPGRVTEPGGDAAALRHGDDCAYVNFIGDEGEAGVWQAYPGPTWDRLAEVKRHRDLTNLFQRNQNIAPAADGAQA